MADPLGVASYTSDKMNATPKLRGFAPIMQPIRFNPYIADNHSTITVPTVARPANSTSTYTSHTSDLNPRPRKRVRTNPDVLQTTNRSPNGPDYTEGLRRNRPNTPASRWPEVIDLTETDDEDDQATRGSHMDVAYHSFPQPALGGLPELRENSPLGGIYHYPQAHWANNLTFPPGQVAEDGQDQAELCRTQAMMNAQTIQTPSPPRMSRYSAPTPTMQALMDIQRALEQQERLEQYEYLEEQEWLADQQWYEQLEYYEKQERRSRLAGSRAETQRQIRGMRAKGHLVLHDLESPESIPEDECVICLEVRGIEDCIQLACRHRFHTPCLLRWFDAHNTCPTCRANVITD